MRMYDLIDKKKNGGALSAEEIRFMVQGFTCGNIPDYQMSAMLMAICFSGMDETETLELTLAMKDSGDTLDLSGIKGVKVDKHSTGGVGDKTIDKLECFPGFCTALPEEKFMENVNRIGIAIAGQTANLAPADKKLYALRDVTATVAQRSLIASSIMSKKLASGSDAIVLDVKTGNGAFMKQEADAAALAETMVKIGNMAGKKTAAIITDMEQPLGNAVGNSLEVIEALQALRGEGPDDLMEVTYALGAQMLLFAGVTEDRAHAVKLLKQTITSRSALHKFAEFVKAQGGDPEDVMIPGRLPVASEKIEAKAAADGFVTDILAEQIGVACMTLGGGRETKESAIDLSVGICLKKKIGAPVSRGDVIAEIYANDKTRGADAKKMVEDAYRYGEIAPEKRQMIRKIITE